MVCSLVSFRRGRQLCAHPQTNKDEFGGNELQVFETVDQDFLKTYYIRRGSRRPKGRMRLAYIVWAYTLAVAITGLLLWVQTTGSTRPTMKTQATTPSRHTLAVMANGSRKFPVLPTTNPVRAGPITPARLAKPFCQPYHFPTAPAPARV